jgi:hypothetical protein
MPVGNSQANQPWSISFKLERIILKTAVKADGNGADVPFPDPQLPFLGL